MQKGARFCSRKLFLAGCVVALVLVFVVGYCYRQQLGLYLWETTRSEQLATVVSSQDANLYFEIGNYYFKTAHYNFNKARHYLIKAVGLDDDHLKAHYQLSRVYFIEGSFYSAIQHMDRVLELDDEFEQAYYMKGLIHGFRGDHEEAVAGFKKFNEMRPTNWAGYNDLAWVYFRAGEYENARDAALAGLANSPENMWLNNSLGVALLNLDDGEGALEAFLKAKESADEMTPADWGVAYPGNDPRMYPSALEETRKSIDANIELIELSS